MPRTEFEMLTIALSLPSGHSQLMKLRMIICALERKQAQHSDRIIRAIRKTLIAIGKRDDVNTDDQALALRLRLRLDSVDPKKLAKRALREQRTQVLRARLQMPGSNPDLLKPADPPAPTSTKEGEEHWKRIEALLNDIDAKKKESSDGQPQPPSSGS